jgi:hypothetical protein
MAVVFLPEETRIFYHLNKFRISYKSESKVIINSIVTSPAYLRLSEVYQLALPVQGEAPG